MEDDLEEVDDDEDELIDLQGGDNVVSSNTDSNQVSQN